MKDPTIDEMRQALAKAEELLPWRNWWTGTLEVMARRYLAMMEEGPVGVMCSEGDVWPGDDIDKEDLGWPEGAPHRHVYAHPTTTHTEED